MSTRIPLSQLPGTTELVRDYIEQPDRVRSFFPHPFTRIESFQTVADRIPAQQRNDLCDILERQNRNMGAEKQTFDHIDLLRQPETLAVVTGQQVGLFSGPLYTIYKSLTTIRYADYLSKELDRRVVPVFYLVSEDHDIEEIRWAGVVNRKNRYQSVSVPPPQESDRFPASEVMLDASITSSLETLLEELPDTEFKETLANALKSAYQLDVSYADAFSQWFSYLFREFGVILVDASDPALKPLMLPVFQRELEDMFSIRALQQANEELEARGYHQQLTVMPDRPNVFVLQPGRHTLERDTNGFRELSQGQVYTVDELLAHPERLSPKAALRPLVQDVMLPTVAYIGGPGEIAYWAQLGPLYSALDRPMPVVIPRAGFTLVESKIRKHMDRYDISVEGLWQDADAVVRDRLKSRLPDNISDTLGSMHAWLEQSFRELQSNVGDIDPTLTSVVDKAKNNSMKQLDVVEKKVTNALTQREKTTRNQLEAVRVHLFPEEAPQERRLNIVPFLIRHGMGLIPRLYHEITPGQLYHTVMDL